MSLTPAVATGVPRPRKVAALPSCRQFTFSLLCFCAPHPHQRRLCLAKWQGVGGAVDAAGASGVETDGVLPLEVGAKVMCLWRDDKYHQVK